MSDLHEIFPHVDPRHIPSLGTRAHAVLMVLSDGERHSSRKLENAIAATVRDERPLSVRSALQALANNQYGYWLVHNRATHSQPGVYQLDHRHLSDKDNGDAQARTERHRELLETSLVQAQRETRRVEHALRRLEKFQAGQSGNA